MEKLSNSKVTLWGLVTGILLAQAIFLTVLLTTPMPERPAPATAVCGAYPGGVWRCFDHYPR